jgi:L-gulonolactone oxidase
MSARVEVLAEQLRDLPYAKPHCKSGDVWHNWSRVHGECRPARHYYPQSIEEVAAIVRDVAKMDPRPVVRVAGGGLSPNASTFTTGVLIHTDHLRRILAVDEAKRTVTAQAGITLKELAADLETRKLALPMVPSVLEPTLGGAIATATHGSGINIKSLSGYVRSVQVVDGLGQLHTIDRSTPVPASVAALLPAGQKTCLLDAFACHLGMLGVVVAVELAVERLAVYHALQQPISLVDARKLGDQRATVNEHYRLSWTPHTDLCVELIAKKMAAADDDNASSVADTVHSAVSTTPATTTKAPAKLTLQQQAHRVGRAVQLVSNPATSGGDLRHWEEEQQSALFRAAKAVKGPWLKHDATENALALACTMPTIQASVNRVFHHTFLSEREEAYGPIHRALTLDCLMHQHGMEFAVEARRWRELLDATVNMIRDQKLHVHFPVEVRFVDAESTWLAPNHGRKTCFIGIVMYKPKGRNPPDWQRYFAGFERLATAMDGRPHWGKTYDSWRSKDFRRAYPCFDAFIELQKVMDPHGLFMNQWFRQIIA